MIVRVRAEWGKAQSDLAVRALETRVYGEWTEIKNDTDEEFENLINNFFEQHPKCRNWNILFDYEDDQILKCTSEN